ncbi:hypothetical protein L7F22_056843 [Adiantum nelumboides]|nr:hypothetical protein [Adiantum nelumboides]MCO5602707.1 hypothetical protein [Adiantum nelumboides]
MSAFTDGVSKPNGTLEQPRATKLLARRMIEEVAIDGGQSTSQKGVHLKRRKKGQSNIADLDDNKEKKSRESWKDAWVVQLIHIRGARHGEFGRPPKQGVDLWSKVATELASLFPECDKDGEACKKKWGRVYDSYKRDKAHNSISGNDRRVTCEWYEIVDKYMHSWANVVSESHASAIGGKDVMEKQDFMVPTPTDEVVVEEGCDDASFSTTKQKPAPIACDQRHRKDRGIEDSLFDMANTAKIMASQQQERDVDHKIDASERRQLLSSLTCDISGLMEIMKTFKKE